MTKFFELDCMEANEKTILKFVRKHFPGKVVKHYRKGYYYIELNVDNSKFNLMCTVADNLKANGLITNYGIW